MGAPQKVISFTAVFRDGMTIMFGGFLGSARWREGVSSTAERETSRRSGTTPPPPSPAWARSS